MHARRFFLLSGNFLFLLFSRLCLVEDLTVLLPLPDVLQVLQCHLPEVLTSELFDGHVLGDGRVFEHEGWAPLASLLVVLAGIVLILSFHELSEKLVVLGELLLISCLISHCLHVQAS